MPISGEIIADLIARILSYFPSYILLCFPVVAGFALARWVYAEEENEKSHLFWSMVVCAGLLAYPGLPSIYLLSLNHPWSDLHGFIGYTIVLLGIGVFCAFVWWRWVSPKIVWVRDRGARRSIYDEEELDARRLDEYYPAPVTIDSPARFFDPKKGLYLGHAGKKPLYFPAPGAGKIWPHLLVAGTTGAGKGIALAMLGSQFLQQGEGVVFIDPKDDEWAPSVFRAEAERLGVPYRFIDLRRNAPPQFNLLAGCTSFDVERLLEAGLDVSRRGDNADVFRGEERRYLALLAGAYKPGDTLADLWDRHGKLLYEKAKDFANKLWEVARLPSINGTGAPDVLGDVAREGGIVYFCGSTQSEAVRVVQRAIVVRMQQIAEQRDRFSGSLRPLCLVLDEFASSLSLPAIQGLQQMRDKHLHIALAFQSFEDFSAPGVSMEPSYIRGAVNENTPLKLAYRIQEPETQKWLAEKSGVVKVHSKRFEENTNPGGARIKKLGRVVQEIERELIPPMLFGGMPAGCAVAFGVGLPRFVWISPIRVEKSREAVALKEYPGVTVKEERLDADPIALPAPAAGRKIAPPALDGEAPI